jgi:hypothetical protein
MPSELDQITNLSTEFDSYVSEQYSQLSKKVRKKEVWSYP